MSFRRIEGFRRVEEQLERIEKHMSVLDDKITALQAEVANNTTVEQSALTLINGFATQLAAAIAAATAAGATPAQLSELDTLQLSLASNDTGLAAAVAASQPPVPVPVPPGGTPVPATSTSPAASTGVVYPATPPGGTSVQRATHSYGA